MINGTWLLLLLGSFTSSQCLLHCGPSIITLAVAVWTHSTNQDRANHSGVLLVAQLFNQVHYISTVTKKQTFSGFFKNKFKRAGFGGATSFWTVINYCCYLG